MAVARAAGAGHPDHGVSTALPTGEDPVRLSADCVVPNEEPQALTCPRGRRIVRRGDLLLPRCRFPDHGASTALSTDEDPVRLNANRLSCLFDTPEQHRDLPGRGRRVAWWGNPLLPRCNLPDHGASTALPAGEDPVRLGADFLDHGASTAGEDPVRLGAGRLSGTFDALEQRRGRPGAAPNEEPPVSAYPAAFDVLDGGDQRYALGRPAPSPGSVEAPRVPCPESPNRTSGNNAGNEAPPASSPFAPNRGS